MSIKDNMRKVLVFTSIFIMMSIHLFSEDDLSFSGYYKSFATAFVLPVYRLEEGTVKYPDIGALNNRIRLRLLLKSGNKLSFNFAYDFSPRIQDPSLFKEDIFYAVIVPESYRFDDFDNQLYPDSQAETGSFGVFHNLDRFFATIKTKSADIYVGRQAIAWGSAHLINPTDVIAPFTFNELDTEERRGVDALRVRIPLGTMDELDMGFVAGDNLNLKRSAFFLRGKVYLLKTDFSLLFLGFKEHLLIGFDIARSIGGAGFWIEAAYVKPFFFNKNYSEEKQNYIRASTGMDYSFGGKTYAFFEYHFNSAGKKNPADYLTNFSTPAYTDGSVYLMGKHYLNIGFTQEITPLIPFTGLLMINLNDRSLILSPVVEYNVSENIYISIGAYVGLGKRPELVPDPFSVSTENVLKSEFGAYPAMFFTTFRIYF